MYSCSRRKLRSDVQRCFSSIDPDELVELIPNKEEMTVTKITTHCGEMVVFYSVNGEPILFEIEKRIYPTGRFLLKTANAIHFSMHKCI